MMLSRTALENLGVDVKTGLERCMGNETLYFRLIGMALEDRNFEALGKAVGENDLDAAFEAAHALKGMTGNLSLTPLFEPLSEMTEQLRVRKEMDYSSYLSTVEQAKAALEALCQAEG